MRIPKRGYVKWALRQWNADHPMRADEAEVYLASHAFCFAVSAIAAFISLVSAVVLGLDAVETPGPADGTDRLMVVVFGALAIIFSLASFRFLCAIVALPGHFEDCGLAQRPQQKSAKVTLADVMGGDEASA